MDRERMMGRLVSSPCCLPEMDLDTILAHYSKLGFRKFEVFTSWCQSAFDIDADPDIYRKKGEEYGMAFPSLHLPLITDDLDASRERALQGVRFAKALGCGVVLYKATSRENYIKGAEPILDLTEDLEIIPVLQNHNGSPLTTLADMNEVRIGISDLRMRTLLEVGHLHAAGHPWPEALAALSRSIALVHIKDQVGPVSVPFGTGEIDLPGLFQALRQMGYTGDIVVEMEVEDQENTLRYLADALDYLEEHCFVEEDFR